MPIYEFACQKCEKMVEEMLKVDQRGPRKCAHCGGRMKRVMSRSSFHLKGGGWGKDLYSSKKETKETKETGETPAAKSSEEKPAAASSTEAKVDKPAATEAPAKSKKAEPSKKADAKKSVA